MFICFAVDGLFVYYYSAAINILVPVFLVFHMLSISMAKYREIDLLALGFADFQH